MKARKRLITSVEGTEKTGKTHLSMTAPPPIAYFDIDVGSEGVIEKFEDRIGVRWPPEKEKYQEEVNQAQWKAKWLSFWTAYHAALKNPRIRTLVVDTATEAWELCRLAAFGRVDQVLPNQYGPVNKEFRDMIRAAYQTDKNVIFIHKQKDEYVGHINKSTGKEISVRTGRLKRAGFNDMGYLVQVLIVTFRVGKEFGLTITDCRQDPRLNGEKLEGPMATFPFLATQVYTETSEEEWE